MIKNKALTSLACAGLACSLLTDSVKSQEDDSNYGASLGLGYYKFGESFSFEHSLHPDDGYLGPGSQGETTLNHALSINLGLETHKKFNWIEPYAGLSVLFFPGEGDSKPANRGFLNIYSKPFPVGGQINIGARIYPFKESGFSFGPLVQANFIGIEHGWNRFNKDEVEKRTLESFINAGLSVGYSFDDNQIQANVSKGMRNDSTFFSIGYSKRF